MTRLDSGRAGVGPEAAKAALLCLVVPVLVWVVGVPAGAAVALTLAHVGGMALAGFCLMTIFAVDLPPSWPDRLAVCCLAAWGTVPLLVLSAHVVGGLGWGLVLTLGGLGAAALGRRLSGSRGLAGEEPAPVPPGVYLFALVYATISVAIPFGGFTDASIVRELYGDLVQRFGAVYALAEGVPPGNPFVAGAPLGYYWFFLVPAAAEYRLVHGDLFAVWKSAQTWTPVLFLPALWSLLQTLFRSRAVPGAALAFGFVFASWEIVVSHELADALARGLGAITDWGGLARRLLVEAVTSDPDMRIGLLSVHSDQIFMEDFVYIPQNVAALSVTLLALRYAQAGRPGLATFTLSSLAGLNTFFTIPAFTAFTAMHAMRSGARAASLAALALGAYALVWLRICAVLEAVPLGPAVALAALAAFLLARVAPRLAPEPEAEASGADAWLSAAAWACLVALALVVMLRPPRNFGVLALSYGPGFVLGLVFVSRLAVRPSPVPAGARPSLLFLLVAFTVSALVSWVLYLQFLEAAPALVRRLSGALGVEVNLFNFHHKTWKLARLTWAILAGLLLHEAWRRWRAHLASRPALSIVIAALLAVSALAGLIRPFTYLGESLVEPERAAGEYLRRQGHGLATRVLLERFRDSRLNMLAPVSAYYFSVWSGGNPGLTHQVGTWADQYLPRHARPEGVRREALVLRFFSPETTREERARILRDERIDYVLTESRLDLAPLATLVAGNAGGFLYRVRAGPGG